jgi:predicted MFS family arabinose efflux permease
VAHPLLPLRIVLDRNRGGAYLAMFLAAIGMFGVFLFLTYYLEDTLRYSAVKTGVAFLPLTLILVVVAGVGNTILLSKVSARLLIPSGLALAAVGMALLARIGLPGNYAADVLPTLLLVGFGLGLVFAPAFTIGTLGVDPQDAGVASATINVAQQIGGSIGTSLLNTIAATAAAGYITAHAAAMASAASRPLTEANSLVHSYHVVFWVAAAIYVGAAVLTGLLLRPGVALPQGEPAAVGA